MVWELLFLISIPMVLKGQLLFDHEHLWQVKRTIYSLRKRCWAWSLVLRSSINIFMGSSSRCLLIISHWLPSWAKEHVSNIGCSTSATLGRHSLSVSICPSVQEDQWLANADGLSRLPLAKEPGEERDAQPSCFYVGQIQALPVTSEQLEIATRRDPCLSKVVHYTQSGWPASID